MPTPAKEQIAEKPTPKAPLSDNPVPLADPGFSTQESFGLFMEGLRALQLYGDESDKEQPSKSILDERIQESVDRLREAVCFFPRDPLSRYYLGIALTTANQHTYIERLHEIEASLFGWGALLELQNQENPGATALQTAKNDSLDARHLDEEPWPLLREAALHFEQLEDFRKTCLAAEDPRGSCPELDALNSLSRSVQYNLSEVYARFGREADLKKAEAAIGAIPAAAFQPLRSPWLNWIRLPFASPGGVEPAASKLTDRPMLISSWLERKRRTEAVPFATVGAAGANSEDEALELQSHTMWYSIRARLAVLKLSEPHDSAQPDAAQEKEKLISTLKSSLTGISLFHDINASKLDLKFKNDVCADRWTKLGYLNYLQALAPAARLGDSCDTLLSRAEKNFVAALELKANWNPAQIYLAVVYRMHAGVCSVLNQPAEQKRFERKSDELFKSLLGLKPAAASPEPTRVKLEGGVNLDHRVALVADDPPPAPKA